MFIENLWTILYELKNCEHVGMQSFSMFPSVDILHNLGKFWFLEISYREILWE
jgi:hypothetical protein